MAIRRFSGSGISGAKSSKVWDQETLPGYYEAIATAVVDSSKAANVSFSSIPQVYKHLQVRYMAKSDRSNVADYMQIRINGDNTTSNYRTHALDADGASVYGETSANDMQLGGLTGGTNASMFAVGVIDILDYTSTSKNKTIRALSGFDQNSASTGYAWIGLSSGLWLNSSTAITSILFQSGTSSNFAQNSHFALYGLRG